MCKK
jgi:hypothetical protein